MLEEQPYTYGARTFKEFLRDCFAGALATLALLLMAVGGAALAWAVFMALGSFFDWPTSGGPFNHLVTAGLALGGIIFLALGYWLDDDWLF